MIPTYQRIFLQNLRRHKLWTRKIWLSKGALKLWPCSGRLVVLGKCGCKAHDYELLLALKFKNLNF